MFRLTLLLASFLAVAAFAPSARKMSTSLKMNFENEIGVLPPVGYWDPLGLSADGDRQKFLFKREAELKHGRVAMLAVAGCKFIF